MGPEGHLNPTSRHSETLWPSCFNLLLQQRASKKKLAMKKSDVRSSELTHTEGVFETESLRKCARSQVRDSPSEEDGEEESTHEESEDWDGEDVIEADEVRALRNINGK